MSTCYYCNGKGTIRMRTKAYGYDRYRWEFETCPLCNGSGKHSPSNFKDSLYSEILRSYVFAKMLGQKLDELETFLTEEGKKRGYSSLSDAIKQEIDLP